MPFLYENVYNPGPAQVSKKPFYWAPGITRAQILEGTAVTKIKVNDFQQFTVS